MKSTERFSDRVENYRKYRPHYPKDIIGFLEKEIGLSPDSVIADIGSGTGISSELFLQNENTVFGIEPNKAMREAGENFLLPYKKFHSTRGTAEATALLDNLVDLIIAGQAFHWFKIEETKREFLRILKPNGWVVLFWNERIVDASAFSRAYENLLLKFAINYPVVPEKDIRENIRILFSEHGYKLHTFDNSQTFDFQGLEGRLLSSSYAPRPDMPLYRPMLEGLQKIFDEFRKDEQIEMYYRTDVYSGQL